MVLVTAVSPLVEDFDVTIEDLRFAFRCVRPWASWARASLPRDDVGAAALVRAERLLEYQDLGMGIEAQ